MKDYVLIMAGGKGMRMGGELPKQFIPMYGKPILMHTLELFHRWNPAAELILVLPEAYQSYWEMLCREIGCRAPHKIATGGDTRFQSVRNGLEYVVEPGLIGVHDGVRPFVSLEVIAACFEAAAETGSAVPAVPMVESVREIRAEGSISVDRECYRLIQTPQVFRSEILLRAYERADLPNFTDDASVVEADGGVITLVPGNRENIKITTPFDLKVAEALFTE